MQPVAYTEPPLRSALILVSLIAVCQLVGVVGSLITDPSFYEALVRPSWAPPAWLFAPVWVTLYTLMGIAAWLVWRTGAGRRGALAWFAIQLALNAAWTPVFFGLHSIGGGLIVIVILELAILATIVAFARRSRIAAALLVPYAAWVAFATALNASLWWLNR
jgi:tryptophan-rich sensory protein